VHCGNQNKMDDTKTYDIRKHIPWRYVLGSREWNFGKDSFGKNTSLDHIISTIKHLNQIEYIIIYRYVNFSSSLVVYNKFVLSLKHVLIYMFTMLIKLRKFINKVKFQLVIVSDKNKMNCRVRKLSLKL
jgi:hypothetical protein